MTIGELKVVLSLAVTKFKAGLTKAMGMLGMFKKAITGMGSMVKNIAASAFNLLRKAILGVSIALIGITIAGARFEEAMTRTFIILKEGTSASAEQFAQLTEKARELGRETLYSSTQAAQGMTILARSGFEANEVLAMIAPTLEMAIVGALDLAEAAQFTSMAIRSYGLAAEDATRISDVFSLATAKSNMDMRMLGEAFKYVAPVARGAGLTLEELTAAIGMLANAGIQGSMAGTTMRRAIAQMLSPTGAAKEIVKELGITFLNTAGELKPLVQIINELAASGATTSQIMEMFGLRAGPGMIAMVRMGGAALQKLQNQLEGAEGAANRMSQALRTTLIGRLKDLGASVNELAITVYNTFNEALRDSIFMSRNWVTALVEALEKNEKLKTIIAGLLEGLKPLSTIIENIMKKTVEWIENIDEEELRAKFKKIGETITKVLTTAMGVVKLIWDTMVAIFIGEELPEAVGKAWGRVGEIIMGALKGIGIMILGVFAGILAGLIPVVTSLGAEVGKALINAIKGPFQQFGTILNPLLDAIALLNPALASSIEAFKKLMSIPTEKVDFGKAASEGLDKGIKDMNNVMKGAGILANKEFGDALKAGLTLPGMEELAKPGKGFDKKKEESMVSVGGKMVPLGEAAGAGTEELEKATQKLMGEKRPGIAAQLAEFNRAFAASQEKDAQETEAMKQEIENLQKAVSKPSKKELTSGGRNERMR